MKTSLRNRRGFSMLEAVVSSGVFLIGMTGVSLFAHQASRNTQIGTYQAEAALLARRSLEQEIGKGYASLAAFDVPADNDKDDGGPLITLPNGRAYKVDIDVLDTSDSLAPAEPENLGVPSKLIRVNVVWRDGYNRERVLTDETYITP
jgi:hypothetical protein